MSNTVVLHLFDHYIGCFVKKKFKQKHFNKRPDSFDREVMSSSFGAIVNDWDLLETMEEEAYRNLPNVEFDEEFEIIIEDEEDDDW